MPVHWTLRWLAVLALFAIAAFGFSSYAHADPGYFGPDERVQQQGEDAEDPEDGADEDGVEQPPAARPDGSPYFMAIILRSALLGTILGALVGGSYYLLTQRNASPWIIAYASAGGVLFGTLVGILEVGVRESRRPSDTRARRLGPTPPQRTVDDTPLSPPPTRVLIPLVRIGF